MKQEQENSKKLLLQLIKEFYPYAKRRLKFQEACRIGLRDDLSNAKNPLGKTAQYDSGARKITLFIKNRHPKDIMRSLSHELVHHYQNCNGQFNDTMPTGEGYAQKDPRLRKMEQEAFSLGNMIFRDWTETDGKKFDLNTVTECSVFDDTNYKHRRIKDMDWKEKLFEGRHTKLFQKLLHKQNISERINFDPSSHQTEFEETLDEQLVNDIREMLEANEKVDDIEQLLIRGEDMNLEEAWKYIHAAQRSKQI